MRHDVCLAARAPFAAEGRATAARPNRTISTSVRPRRGIARFFRLCGYADHATGENAQAPPRRRGTADSDRGRTGAGATNPKTAVRSGTVPGAVSGPFLPESAFPAFAAGISIDGTGPLLLQSGLCGFAAVKISAPYGTLLPHYADSGIAAVKIPAPGGALLLHNADSGIAAVNQPGCPGEFTAAIRVSADCGSKRGRALLEIYCCNRVFRQFQQ